MPEGPELKYLSLLIQDIISDNIVEIKTFNKKDVEQISGKILNVETKGKQLWIRTNNKYIHIHLGLTGWLYINEEPKNKKYMIKTNKNRIYLDNLATLCILDKDEHKTKIDKLGIDILTYNFTLEYFRNCLNKSKTMIAPFLLKQDKFAGLGNYIKNEALYLAKINPKTKANEIEEKKIDKLYDKIKYVSYSVLSTYINTKMKDFPDKLQVPYKFRIYNRIKDDKGNVVKKEKISGRITYYI